MSWRRGEETAQGGYIDSCHLEKQAYCSEAARAMGLIFLDLLAGLEEPRSSGRDKGGSPKDFLSHVWLIRSLKMSKG